MQGNRQVIAQLNKVLFNALTAINQFFLHSRMFNDWGFAELGEHAYRDSIRQMKHADRLIERILFLEGLPNLQNLGKLLIGENPVESLGCDLGLERQLREDLVAALAQCEEAADYVSRELLVDILEHEEESIDWLQTQLDLVEKLGAPTYLQAQLSS